MEFVEKFCAGNALKVEKYELFKVFLKGSTMNSVQMLAEKKEVFRKHKLRTLFSLSLYGALGFGYGYVISLLFHSVKGYYIMPLLCCSVFGYYDYKEELYTLMKISDKYEFEVFKHFCKKPKQKN